MKPSDSTRRKFLKLSSPQFAKSFIALIALAGVGIGVLIAVILSVISVRKGEAVPLSALMVILLCVVAFEFTMGLFTVIHSLILKLAMSIITKEEVDYPLAETALPKASVLSEASTLTFPDDRWLVDVEGDWIDVSWNWKNAIAVGVLTVNRSFNTFTKMILLHDDCTYEELDKIETTSAVANADVLQLSASRKVQYGRLLRKQHSIEVGEDLNNKHVGVNNYHLDSVEITNAMHKWLADRGYRKREN